MQHARCSSWIRYVVAVATVVCCLLLQRLFAPLLPDQSPYTILLLAPMVSAWFGGFRPGLLAIALSLLGAEDSVISPLKEIFGAGVDHDVRAIVFVCEGLFVCWMTEKLHRARVCAEDSERRITAGDVRKDEFLATLGHELRNPLATVRHAVAILKNPRAGESQLSRARDTLERQADYMTRLIDDILDVSRITRGILTFEMRRIDLREAAVVAVEQCRMVFTGRHHELAVTLPRQPVLIDGDLVRLTQVVSNLLSNAAKYTDDGGRIALAIAQTEREVTISVRDNGMGITIDMLPLVFDLFTQSDRARSRSHGGLGLGLTVVRSIVERHGGSVMAVSGGTNLGSEFVVRIPRKVEEPETDKQKRPRRKSAAGTFENGIRKPAGTPPRRILLVDDNADVAHSLGTVLKLDGHDVRIATTKRMAIDMARSIEPEVMLVDLRLPDGDGCDVVRQLAGHWTDRPPALIALTGYWGEEVRQRCLDAGFHAFLLKPVGAAELVGTIEECLASATPQPVARLSDSAIDLQQRS